ncbi:MAG: UDP-N-acetylmuramate--L-alanine ligase [Bacteroidetes bacterium]|nr:UDP-N-acetylmuramate--L-alanine ligase [Bacteroidota bacterium]
MPTLPNIGNVYFLGIGGIGMSALARYFLSRGWNVSGYDKTPSSLTYKLAEEGMNIHFEDDVTQIPEQLDLVVYTPAIPIDHKEFNHLKDAGIPFMKRAEVLGAISDGFKTIAIAGTHGKTTTTTLCAHLLTQSKLGCQAFLGGISKNYESNLLLSAESKFLVAEADEFDRSFLQLHPKIAVITSIDADHLDIYGDHNSLVQTFSTFTGNIQAGGSLILKKGLNLELQLNQGTEIYSYSMIEAADFYASSIRLVDGLYHFNFHFPGGTMKDLVLGLPGLYNIENAVAALASACLAGTGEDELRPALASFQGVRRRFDIRIRRKGLVYIDDYAHHPAELTASITAARNLFQGKKLTGIFQPHLYSRTRDFADEFARSLELLDEIILLPIYPARELPIPGVDSEMLLSKIQGRQKYLVSKSELIDHLHKTNIEILMTLGAGDIDTLVEPIETYLNKLIIETE